MAQRIFDFFSCLRFTEGEHVDLPFELTPWQKFVQGSIFGWFNEDGTRRYRTAYIEIGKGNGKTPMAAATGLYALIADGEWGAEIYSAAVTRDQARIAFRDAERFVEGSPALRRRILKHRMNIAFAQTNSFFRPVSSEGRSLDGLRVHMAIVDELHEHPSSEVVDKLRAGTKGRRNALIYEITNSGYDRNSVCWHHHEYSVKVLQGIVENDSWFAYVCALDEGDDPFEDESCWVKANPNLGVSLTEKYLREQVEEAKAIPAKRNIVLRLNFCVWTEQASRWLPMVAWDGCSGGVSPSEIEESCLGMDVWGGLDLSSTTDITAFVLDVPLKDGCHAWIARFWVPEANIRRRAIRDRVPYDVWVREGWIIPTEGDVVDYERVRADINALAERYHIREIAIDRWNATHLATQLSGDGFTVVPFGQGFASMSAPAKELEKLVVGHKLVHGGHPVLRWMASNVAVQQDAAGNLKPAKDKSGEKIDGIVAGIMALGRSMVASPQADKPGIVLL